MISVILLSYILILSFSSAFIEAACYYPNGSIAPNDTPCRDDTAESTCCGQGYACLSNGMCQATGSELQKDGATELVRGACTDRSWRSSSCPLFCINPETDNVGGGIGVAKCQGTTQELYYCINSVQDQVNCTAKQNVLFFQQSATAITTIGVEATTSIASTTTTSELSASASTSAVTSAATLDPSRLPSQNPIITSSAVQSPTNSPTNQPDAESDRGVTIGAAVGASIGGLALGASGVWLFFFLRRRRRAREQAVGDRAPSYAPSYAPQYQSPPPHQVYEAPVEWKPPVSHNQHFSPQELPAWEHNRR
ncbi:hypothetical protein CCHR01_12636 [Colletotrichum chrysophilum]|uniref:Mid2 domain-containing protein n=1 Tax=Colletotrichum chrysophilum TaxID=1836956 RepID=A0AAD9EB72_9PEZI|nr:hypothetical protein CCHR01_12636 [Colletotrichum chrysophilum]